MAIAVRLVVAQAIAPDEPQARPEAAALAAPDLALTAVEQTRQDGAGVALTATVRNLGRAAATGGLLEAESKLGRYREPLPEVQPNTELPPITFRLPPRTDWRGPAGTYPVTVSVRSPDATLADANEANNSRTITVWLNAAPVSHPQPPAPPAPQPRWWPPHWLVPAAGALAILVVALASQLWRSRRPRPPSVDLRAGSRSGAARPGHRRERDERGGRDAATARLGPVAPSGRAERRAAAGSAPVHAARLGDVDQEAPGRPLARPGPREAAPSLAEGAGVLAQRRAQDRRRDRARAPSPPDRDPHRRLEQPAGAARQRRGAGRAAGPALGHLVVEAHGVESS